MYGWPGAQIQDKLLLTIVLLGYVELSCPTFGNLVRQDLTRCAICGLTVSAKRPKSGWTLVPISGSDSLWGT